MSGLSDGESGSVRPPTPPWQIDTGSVEVPESVARGDELVEQGNLTAAVDQYRKAEKDLLADGDNAGAEQAVTRRVSTMLKLGRSKEALVEVSTYLSKRGLAIGSASTELALPVAFAYLHQAQFDQTLAWLGVALRNAPNEQSARYVRIESKKLIRSLPQHSFENYADKWGKDPEIGAIFAQDRLRRSQGGGAEVSYPPGLFSPNTYTVAAAAAGAAALNSGDSTAVPVPGDGSYQPGGDPNEIVIGVLLPFTGKYSDHSARVREGVELAVSELSFSGQLGNGARIRVVYGDTKGDGEIAAAEYRRLVSVEHATAVIGPLLVKDTERVAAEAASIGVPFLTFTKQPQAAGLGRSGFRLGATVENQAAELASYAVKQLGLRRLTIVSPATQGGRDFSSACRAAVQRAGGGLSDGPQIVGEIEYQNGDEASIGAAVDSLSKLSTDGVFIPDSLENSIPLLDSARAAGLRPVFLGTALWDDSVTIRGYGKLIDGAVYVTPFYSQSSQPATAAFVAGYRTRFNREPDLLAAQAYDATHYILEGLEKSGKPGSPAYPQLLTKKLLSADTFEGATGKISVGKNGELSRRMSVLRLHNGEAVEVMSGGETKGFIPDGETPSDQNKQG